MITSSTPAPNDTLVQKAWPGRIQWLWLLQCLVPLQHACMLHYALHYTLHYDMHGNEGASACALQAKSPPEVVRMGRTCAINQVLGTDMKKHFDIVSRFQVGSCTLSPPCHMFC